MAESNSTRRIINGFEQISGMDIECFAHITFEQAKAMGAMFRAIARLTDDREIKGLCEHGDLQAELAANDIDVLRERVVRAGLAAEAA